MENGAEWAEIRERIFQKILERERSKRHGVGDHGADSRLNWLLKVRSHLTFSRFSDILMYPRSAFYYFKNH